MHSHTESRDYPPDWNDAEPAHIPRPTYWPAVLSFGVTFALWGIVTSWIISAVGVGIFVFSLAGWIKEIVHEHI